MPQVDFYTTREPSELFTLRAACRITEKAFHAGLKVHIQTPSNSDSEKLDSLLWTFQDRSFVPHYIYHGSDSEHMVTISDNMQLNDADILINLSTLTPINIERFQRIAEIINNKDESINAGRERYRFYRENGYNPAHHEVFS